MNEFNLSEKVHHPNECSVCKIDDFSKVYFESDVKEFIRLLKEEAKENLNPDESYWFVKFIEEKAGDKFK